jgi:hypothetical protein
MDSEQLQKMLSMSPRQLEALQRATAKLRKIQPKQPKNKSRSGVKGIYYQFDKKRWNINILHKGKSIYVGISNCLESAKIMQTRKIVQLKRENKLPTDYTL